MFGSWLAAHDIKIIFAIPGVIIATLFVTLRDKAEDDRSQHEAEEHVSDGSTQGQGRAAVGMSVMVNTRL